MALGSPLFLNKSKPSGVFKANLYMKYNEVTGRILLEQKTRAILDKLDALLKGRIVDDRIDVMESDTALSDNDDPIELDQIEEEIETDIDDTE